MVVLGDGAEAAGRHRQGQPPAAHQHHHGRPAAHRAHVAPVSETVDAKQHWNNTNFRLELMRPLYLRK